MSAMEGEGEHVHIQWRFCAYLSLFLHFDFLPSFFFFFFFFLRSVSSEELLRDFFLLIS